MLANLQHEINSAKEPGVACLSILRRLNVEHGAHVHLINQLYAWVIHRKILTPQDVENQDLQLFRALERHHRRRDEAAHTLKENLVASKWGVGWHQVMGYKNVPGKHILGLCVTLSGSPLSLTLQDVMQRAEAIQAKEPRPIRGGAASSWTRRDWFRSLNTAPLHDLDSVEEASVNARPRRVTHQITTTHANEIHTDTADSDESDGSDADESDFDEYEVDPFDGDKAVEPRREVRISADGTRTTVIHIANTLVEVVEEATGFVEDPVKQPDYSGLEVMTGDVLFLTSDGYTLANKKTAIVDTISTIASSFEDMRRVFANKRGAGAGVKTTALPVPEDHDHRHNALKEMRRLYLPSRCGVFHFCYRIPLGQKPETICLSSDMTSGCYKADAVWRFLEECWGFQQQATDIVRSIDPELARQSQECVDKVRRWSRAFHIFGPTLFLGMAVLHNVQVRRHLDPGDNKLGLVAMTNWGDCDGGDLILHIMGQPYRLQYQVGDMITFRSAIIMHEIMPFNGERSAIVLFSKSNALAFVERTNERPIHPVIALADTLDTDREAELAELSARKTRDERRQDGQEQREVKKRRGGGC